MSLADIDPLQLKAAFKNASAQTLVDRRRPMTPTSPKLWHRDKAETNPAPLSSIDA